MAPAAARMFWTVFTASHAGKDLRLPCWSPVRLRRLQDRRVRAMIRHAYHTVPHYRRMMDRLGLIPADFRTAADLEKLPMTDGRELADDPRRFISSAANQESTLVLETTGTSGHFKRIHHDPRAVFLARAAGRRRREVLARYVGRSHGYRDLYVGPRGGTRDQVLDFYTRRSWVPSRLDLSRSRTSTSERFAAGFETINRRRPDVISGFGAYIGALYRRTRSTGVGLHRPAVITYGGDHMQPADRRLIEEDLGVPVVSSYQSCECLNIAFQCAPGSGFHVSVDQVALRIADSDDETLPPGETGEIVVSNLTNRATVLLSYRIGDLGALSAEPCPCGRTLPVLQQLAGRAFRVEHVSDIPPSRGGKCRAIVSDYR